MKTRFSRFPFVEDKIISKVSPSGAVCIGNFDGIHIGHKELIKIAREKSIEHGLANKEISLLSLYPHPRNVLFSEEKRIDLITPLRARINLLKNSLVDNLILLRFSKKIAKLTAEEFITEIVIKIFNPKLIVVGFDWHFGANRMGNPEVLKQLGLKYGFQVFIMPEYVYQGRKVGARDVRDRIIEGDMQSVSRLLGNNLTLSGIVVKGDGRGKQLGFPTANIRLFRQLYPKKGVYFSKVILDGKKYTSITNIGSRPTFTNSEMFKVETHILDFGDDIYGKEISVVLLDFLRPEKKFNSVTELKEQINFDVESRRSYLGDEFCTLS